MSPIVHVERATGDADLHQVDSYWINQPSSSVASCEEKSHQPLRVVRASAPSRYLRRRGLVPNGANLKIHLGSNNSTGSSSSSTVTSATSAAITPTVLSKATAVHQDPQSLPSLTQANLAKLMEQLNLSPPPLHPDRAYGLAGAPQPAVEVSYFSDGSSTHCDLDPE